MAAFTDFQAEIDDKIGKVRQVLAKEGLAAILLTQQHSVLWLTAGHNNHILWDEPDSLLGLLITADGAWVYGGRTDSKRCAEEEFGDYPFEYREVPWYSSAAAEAARSVEGKIGIDTLAYALPNEVYIDNLLVPYRTRLMDVEVERSRAWAREATKIMTVVAKEARPGMREIDFAAMLAKEYIAHDFTISVIVCGADERDVNYRHQPPSSKKIDKFFAFCPVVKKSGLVWSMTRIVSFGPPPAFLAENQRLAETVYVYLNSLANVGTNLRTIFTALPEVYGSIGRGHEWASHSQGGVAGYKIREASLSPSVDFAIVENNMVGWNPSLPGALAEDIYLTKKDGLEYISCDEEWPHQEIKANGLVQPRPAILVL